jgi:hypothetical protein
MAVLCEMKYRLAAIPAPATIIGTFRLDFQAKNVVRPPRSSESDNV